MGGLFRFEGSERGQVAPGGGPFRRCPFKLGSAGKAIHSASESIHGGFDGKVDSRSTFIGSARRTFCDRRQCLAYCVHRGTDFRRRTRSVGLQ